MKSTEKKQTYFLRAAMMVLTTILIVLFFIIISLVSKIQGTARVINYAGLVRGGTQLMVKLEISQEPQDEKYREISDYIEGLRYGSEELNLICLEDKNFQNKMDELACYFEEVRSELLLVREKGYENTEIIQKSDQFFQICDEAVGYAEVYSQKKATALDYLEKVVFVDILGLILIIGTELIRAFRFAAQNKILQKKVYLDEATGLPNKNKCEEILNVPGMIGEEELVALCVFDLNNLRIINNDMGHDRGDEYIRLFAELLREAVPKEFFTGRDGGDEFLVVLKGMDHSGVRECLQRIRDHVADYSRKNPQLPISYAAGYALSSDFDGCTMKDLFRFADKNMYIDKNQARMEEAAQKQRMDRRILAKITEEGYEFSSCMYCDAFLDKYYVLRTGSKFFLADDGSYSGAVEQVIQKLSDAETRKNLRKLLQIEYLQKHLTETAGKFEIPYHYEDNEGVHRGRITVLYLDGTEDGRLHHFVLGFEAFQNSDENTANEQQSLTRYYEQLRQSIVENGNYAEALLQTAHAVYTVDLTNDRLERVFFDATAEEIKIEVHTPCSYTEYCRERCSYVTDDTIENYRIVDSSQKLLRRFETGSRQVTVEYRESGKDEPSIWLQKTVLMSRDIVYDPKTDKESTVVHGIILFKNTSEFHEKEEKENERLKIAIEEADSENRAKTEFMNRMSHDIRTPINGIMGMLDIIYKNRQDEEKVNDSLHKIQLSTSHLLELVNDVLDMSKLEAGKLDTKEEAFDLEKLMDEVDALMEAQLTQTGIAYRRHEETIRHTKLYGTSLQLRRIMLNLLSNAVKYNKENGTIDTYVQELSDDGEIALLEFKIVDSGTGMSREFIENELFKPFTQETNDARTKYRGTGLGMSIVKALIDLMGGTIEVESELGKGTAFIFRIPFKIDQNIHQQDEMEPQEHPQERMLRGMKILLAEDNEINMEIAEFYLTELGTEVDKAWNGKEAVEKFAGSEPGRYDAILMDVMMPVMDGISAAKHIRKLKREDAGSVLILAITAQVSEENARKCLDAGMDGYIPKPIDARKLGMMLRKTS